MRLAAWVTSLTLAGCLAGAATAQIVIEDEPRAEPNTIELPQPAADLLDYINAEFWSDQERVTLRVEHGLWEPAELTTPALTARAMLIAGRPAHPSLTLPMVDVLDRAEAMVQRGELEQALELLEGEDAIRAHRLRAEALELLGRYQQADKAIDPVVEVLLSDTLDDADELIDGVLALMVRSRVRGPSRENDPRSAVSDFGTLMKLLARARDELDRQSWRARAVEAELLYDKANVQQSVEAAMEALARNPKAARVWHLLGRISVDRFDFERSEAAAVALDGLADGPSPWAALIRARAALAQNDVAGALALVDTVLAQTGSQPEALALRCAIVASTFDDEARREALREYDVRFGGRPHHAVLEAGMRMSQARQYALADALLREAIDRQPMLSHSWAELGLMSMQAGRDEATLEALREAARLDPFNIRAVNTLALAEQLVEWPTLESEHFVVRYREGIDELLAREMLPVLEEIHAAVTGPDGFDHEPSQETLIELMPDHATFAVRITGMPALHTVAAATGPAIAMESPQEGPGFSTGTYDWPRVLKHEYAHTVTLSRTSNRIPHWFTEAAAVWMESSPRPWGWWQLLAQAFKDDSLFGMDEISLRFVRPLKPGDRTQAYAQGHWMYEYMVHAHGPAAPLELMDLYAEGTSQDAAMRDVLGLGEEEFFANFLAWAADDLRQAGLLVPEGQPTLAQLARQAEINLEQPPQEWDREVLVGWLQEHPGHPEVLTAAVRARLADRGNRPLSAVPDLVPLLRRLADARPVDPMPHRELARLALSGELAGATDEANAIAIEHLEYLDQRESNTPVFARALVERYARSGDLDRAWAKAERAVNTAPFDPALRELAATVAVQSKRWDDAERMLNALAELEPDREIHRRRLDAIARLRADD